MNWTDGFTHIDGRKVYFQNWTPDKPPIAWILLVHGLGEHSSRYQHVGDFFTRQGLALTGFDLLGHGKTEGQRGHAESYDEYCHQVDHLLSKIQETQPGVPLFLYGHSMGGLISLYHIRTNKPENIKGVICTSPGLATGFPVPAWKMTLGNLLYKLAPRFSMNNGLPVEGLTHDKSVISAYKADPLNHPHISARMGMDLIRNGQEISKTASDFPLPLLLMVGEDDYVISSKAIIDYGKKAGANTTLKVWPGGFHELHNEINKEDVLTTIVEWVKTNVAK
ncbi:MAG: alpha/beta hydrolase [Leptolinea sp.]|nr:alpha/beta hydrolase [Leptolinea sp.]